MLDDPRGQTESQWLDVLDYLAARFEAATSSKLHVGRYWCDDAPGDQSASITARIRSRSPLPGVESDYWEAALCYTGRKKGGYANIYAFPFLRESPVTRRGRLADGLPNDEVDEFRLWQFDDNEFADRGWCYPDGNGEWSWIHKPGDEYRQNLDVQTAADCYEFESPIIVRVKRRLGVDFLGLGNAAARYSLVHVNRSREQTNLVPWNTRPPRPNSKDVVTAKIPPEPTDSIELNLRNFRIRGSWIPGRYHVALRIQGGQDSDGWTYWSEISSPFRLIIE
ncbi:hypothetical protein Mal52_20310 [Symmachiella dynata]|uniref:Uncharacterized protein n=1 Tax=Symmachiella dynata TaxID=2527995 RepID=A0A517ZMA5_9PLAN|nr:hypothetical protein Mal52_20310 [Symmachiella dynata]